MAEGDVGGAIESADTVVPDQAETPTGVTAEELPAGERVGRYVLLSPLGRGGMGTVYKAFDPELDRPVALKIVKLASGAASHELRMRVAREAQAIAKLAHPNVVAVHDVGVAGEHLFIAMEYVEGATLRAWSRRADRGWREVVDLYIRAGRGLAAAHAAGLIHRDFKPENVLVGDDGRPRVLDFGLVRAAGEEVIPTTTTLPRRSKPLTMSASTGPLSTPLTRAGEIMGTPGYMAPEQYTGASADEKSDQFAFCVTMYEALYRQRPYPGNTVGAVKRAVLTGVAADEPKGSRVPRRVRQLLLRGLSVNRDERFPSMDAVLAELERSLSSSTRHRVAAALGVVGVVALAFGLAAAGSDDIAPCSAGARKLTGVWDGARRDALRGAFDGEHTALAKATFARVATELDGYSSAWVDKHRAVCEATEIHREQSEAALDLRMRCLDRQLTELREAVSVLVEGDSATLQRAAVVVGHLPRLADCDDLDRLDAIAPPPKDDRTRAQLASIEARLGRAKALADGGRVPDARVVAQEALAEAGELGYEPAVAHAAKMRATVARLEGDGETAYEHAFRAMVLAERVGDDLLRADATVDLVFITGYLNSDADSGFAFGDMASALLARLGGRERFEARLRSNLGAIQHANRQFGPAVDNFLASLALGERAWGPDSFDIVAALNNLGSGLNELGRNDEAKAHLERARAILERMFGPNHPHIAAVSTNLGLVTYDLGEHDDALDHYRRAVSIYEAVYGPNHAMVAYGLTNQADLLADLQRFDDAYAMYERAIAIRETSYGPDSPLVASALLGYGGALAQAARLTEAADTLQRALTIFRANYPEDHVDVGRVLQALGQVRSKQGRYREALALLERALDIAESGGGKGDLAVVGPLSAIGQAHLSAGHANKAIAPLEQAVATATSRGATASTIARSQLALAQALWSDVTQRGRARELAERSLASLEGEGKTAAPYLAEAKQWLADHPAP